MEIQQQPLQNYGGDFNNNQAVAPVITIKEWMITTLIMLIPIVNIVMMFVWAFGEGNPTKKNYFKASLIWVGIVIVLYIILGALFLNALISGIMDAQ
ncbi:hypothetical protein D3C73_918540 [compost metagenome]